MKYVVWICMLSMLAMTSMGAISTPYFENNTIKFPQGKVDFELTLQNQYDKTVSFVIDVQEGKKYTDGLIEGQYYLEPNTSQIISFKINQPQYKDTLSIRVEEIDGEGYSPAYKKKYILDAPEYNTKNASWFVFAWVVIVSGITYAVLKWFDK